MYFFRKYKDRMMVAAVTIILLIIIGKTSQERESITKVEKVVGNIFTPINKVSFNIGEKMSEVFEGLRDISTLKEENQELKLKVAKLEEENRNYLNVIGKIDYLKNEAALLENTQYNMLPAQIIAKEPGNWYNRFTIDKGLKHGVKKGATIVQAVEVEHNIIQEGIVGRVVDVGDNFAKVISIVDELNSISFNAIRTQDGGVISESVDGEIRGYLFDSKADIIVGDKLFSSGLGGQFLKDLYIGEISDIISDDEDLMKRIQVLPAINFKKLHKVYIILE